MLTKIRLAVVGKIRSCLLTPYFPQMYGSEILKHTCYSAGISKQSPLTLTLSWRLYFFGLFPFLSDWLFIWFFRFPYFISCTVAKHHGFGQCGTLQCLHVIHKQTVLSIGNLIFSKAELMMLQINPSGFLWVSRILNGTPAQGGKALHQEEEGMRRQQGSLLPLLSWHLHFHSVYLEFTLRKEEDV